MCDKMGQFFEYLKVSLWQCRVKKCCYVAPLRLGLMCLAYIQGLVSILQIIGIANDAVIFMPVIAHVQGDINGDDGPSKVACILPPAIDLAFSAVLLCGLYRTDLILLRVYSWYGLISIILSFMVYGLLEFVINNLYLLVIVLVGIYQIYVLVLVRSLMIEIHLQTVGAKTEFIYNKGQEAVIIRDVESPTPGTLPALMAPGMATSITTLNTVNEQNPAAADSRYSTLNKTATLKTATLNNRSKDPIDLNAQKSATLPSKDTTALIHSPMNTQRIGAIQSLGGANVFKTVGSASKDVKTDPAATSSTTNVSANKTESIKKPKEVLSETESDDKAKDISKKRKRGFFSRAPKEKTQKDNVTVKVDVHEDSASKLPDSNPDTSKKDPVNVTSTTDTTTESSAPKTSRDADSKVEAVIETIEESVAETKEDGKKEEAPQKKKRRIFKKSSKETKEKEDNKKGGKS